MACNRDRNCRNIANNYRHAKEELQRGFSTLKNSVSDISEELSELVVPNDYLGGKITEKLSKINLDFQDDINSIQSVESAVIAFASNKQNEHQRHYVDWLDKQTDSLE